MTVYNDNMKYPSIRRSVKGDWLIMDAPPPVHDIWGKDIVQEEMPDVRQKCVRTCDVPMEPQVEQPRKPKVRKVGFDRPETWLQWFKRAFMMKAKQ